MIAFRQNLIIGLVIAFVAFGLYLYMGWQGVWLIMGIAGMGMMAIGTFGLVRVFWRLFTGRPVR